MCRVPQVLILKDLRVGKGIALVAGMKRSGSILAAIAVWAMAALIAWGVLPRIWRILL